MTSHDQRTALSAEDLAAVARFIAKRPDIYQRWLERRRAAKAKLAAVLQGLPCNQSRPTDKKPGA
jgi:hypothetical protein